MKKLSESQLIVNSNWAAISPSINYCKIFHIRTIEVLADSYCSDLPLYVTSPQPSPYL